MNGQGQRRRPHSLYLENCNRFLISHVMSLMIFVRHDLMGFVIEVLLRIHQHQQQQHHHYVILPIVIVLIVMIVDNLLPIVPIVWHIIVFGVLVMRHVSIRINMSYSIVIRHVNDRKIILKILVPVIPI